MITANIATMESRRKILPLMVQSIYNQFDRIRICCNDMPNPPQLRDPLNKIQCFSSYDLKDNGKFYGLKDAKDELYFTLDDDILYPDDYVVNTLKAIKTYPGCIVTYHGRRLKGQGISYYRGGHKAFRCLGEVTYDADIDIPGTGCAAWETDKFCPRNLWSDKRQRMSDVLLGEAAAEAKVRVVVIQHKLGWMGYLNPPESDTIWGVDSKKATPIQNAICDKIYKLKYL